MRTPTPELIRVIREDLQYLARDWPSGAVTNDELRRCSTVLRRLLFYDDLVTVWIAVRGRIDFLVPASILRISDRARLGSIEFASALPVDDGRVHLDSVALWRKRPGQSAAPYEVVQEPMLPLKRFLDRTCLIASGVEVTRNDIVQFVANKEGGAHFDTGRQRPSEKAIEALRAYSVVNRPFCIYALLSCGQSLAASPSTRELLQALEAQRP